MKAVRFRVRNYRNIDDSGWTPMERVTALVGRNESGKTSLLKALHKFNPATPEPYDAQREFPRDRYARDYVGGGARGGDWPVCSIEFELPARLRDRIGRLLDGDREPPATVTLTRHYDGSLALAYTPAIEERPLAPDPIVNALHDFATAVRWLEAPPADQEQAWAAQRRELADWAAGWNDRLRDLDDLRGAEGARLLGELGAEVQEISGPLTASLVAALAAALEPVLQAAAKGSVLERINEAVAAKLPVLIYFENYGILDSAIWLPQFLDDLDRAAADPRVRTVNAVFRHVGLDPREIADLGEGSAGAAADGGVRREPERDEASRRRREERAIRLNAASLDISRRFSTWWSQRRHKIRYHADGDYFRVWIADDRRPDVEIELEARSRGFQWFFSFYLVFLVESEAGHKNAILLLDEPGLHLHPTAQQELVAFLEKLSEKNQIAYTTHSPFLIDGDHLRRVRPVTEDDAGRSRVAGETWAGDPETIFTLQAAAAHAMLRGLFHGRKNVLVGELSDLYYLQVLSQQCARTGRTALPDGVRITPCGGIRNIAPVASLFMARDLRPLVLLDGEDAGRTRRDALASAFHAHSDGGLLMLDEVVNRPGQDVALEDILGEEVVLAGLEALLAEPLALAAPNGSGASLPRRIEDEAARRALDLPAGWRASAALSLASSWAQTGTILADHVLDAAAALFRALADRLEDVGGGAAAHLADGSGEAVEDDPDLLRLLLRTVGEGAEEEGGDEAAGQRADAVAAGAVAGAAAGGTP